MTTVIVLEHLRKTYGRKVAVDDVSFAVEAGEIFGILGPNGAGKTTTVECLQGLRAPDGGTMRVLGLDPTNRSAELRQRIGSQLQVTDAEVALRQAQFNYAQAIYDFLTARAQLELAVGLVPERPGEFPVAVM